ncbi:hypothetical protein D3C72_1790420 [compost metagenome]
MNGCRLLVSNAGRATATKMASAISLNTTRIALRVALSLVPAISISATSQVMTMAGRLIMPPSTCGPAASMAGRRRSQPNWVCTHSRKPTK